MDKHQEELLRRARKFDQRALVEIKDQISFKNHMVVLGKEMVVNSG
jgi:hypothetical protein